MSANRQPALQTVPEAPGLLCRTPKDTLTKLDYALQPVVDAAEGEALQVAADYDTGRFRLTGNVSQQLPAGGTVLHGGWEATQCELPAWTGSESAARVVAPAEVELS